MSHPALPRTPDRFAAWLRAAPAPRSVVDWRDRTGGCPLAQYLHAQGMAEPWVGSRDYCTHGQRPRRLPRWARTFLDILDAQNTQRASVTAKEALAILADLMPPTKETSHAR
jgi:hypothetical protein